MLANMEAGIQMSRLLVLLCRSTQKRREAKYKRNLAREMAVMQADYVQGYREGKPLRKMLPAWQSKK